MKTQLGLNFDRYILDNFKKTIQRDMFEEEDLKDLTPIVNRYEKMLRDEAELFFDVDEFEALCDFYYERGKLKMALKVVEMGIRQHPYHAGFTAKKVHYFTANNQIKEAKEEIEKLESLSPEGYDLFMARAAIHSRTGDHQKAINFYKKAIPFADFAEDIWPLMAVEYQVMGNYELALKYLKSTLDVHPEDEISVYNIALCYDLLEETEEGIKYFNKFVDINPYSEIAWYHLGILYTKQKEYPEAERALDYSILIDDTFIAAYYEKARLLERTFRYQEALETYESSFEFDGPTGFSYYKIGICHLKMHKPKKAHVFFTKAIHEDPDLDEAFYELAIINDEDREHTEAIHHIDKAVHLDPDNWDYLFTSAEIHKRAGQLNEAEEIYKSLIEKGYLDPDVFIDYAELLFDLCEFDDGMDLLYKGVEHNPESADMQYRLSGYLYTLTESDEANIYFSKALSLDPDRRVHFFQLFPKLKENAEIKDLVDKISKP